MKFIQKLNEDEFLMECIHGHRVITNTLNHQNFKVIRGNLVAVCPICGDDESEIIQTDICC